MKRRFLLLVLLLSAAAVLCACSDGGEAETPSEKKYFDFSSLTYNSRSEDVGFLVGDVFDPNEVELYEAGMKHGAHPIFSVLEGGVISRRLTYSSQDKKYPEYTFERAGTYSVTAECEKRTGGVAEETVELNVSARGLPLSACVTATAGGEAVTEIEAGGSCKVSATVESDGVPFGSGYFTDGLNFYKGDSFVYSPGDCTSDIRKKFTYVYTYPNNKGMIREIRSELVLTVRSNVDSIQVSYGAGEEIPLVGDGSALDSAYVRYNFKSGNASVVKISEGGILSGKVYAYIKYEGQTEFSPYAFSYEYDGVLTDLARYYGAKKIYRFDPARVGRAEFKLMEAVRVYNGDGTTYTSELRELDGSRAEFTITADPVTSIKMDGVSGVTSEGGELRDLAQSAEGGAVRIPVGVLDGEYFSVFPAFNDGCSYSDYILELKYRHGVLSFDADGRLIAALAGTETVTAYSPYFPNVKAELVVTVTDPVVSSELRFSETAQNLFVGMPVSGDFDETYSIADTKRSGAVSMRAPYATETVVVAVGTVENNFATVSVTVKDEGGEVCSAERGIYVLSQLTVVTDGGDVTTNSDIFSSSAEILAIQYVTESDETATEIFRYSKYSLSVTTDLSCAEYCETAMGKLDPSYEYICDEQNATVTVRAKDVFVRDSKNKTVDIDVLTISLASRSE